MSTGIFRTSDKAEIEKFLNYLVDHNIGIKGGCALVICEAHGYLDGTKDNIFNRMYKESRHHGLMIVADSQKVQDLPKFVTTNSDAVAIGYSPDKHDREYFTHLTSAFPDKPYDFIFNSDSGPIDPFLISVNQGGYKEGSIQVE